ncbi:hypothetical protein BCV72DRAFT_234901 [Rhizopus microsporus var. microsporus]|uniref:Protein PBN1 n=2 Tax=Rhizopus microsporus TaxID=58291 RepID=A0A2G4SL81_RHIZD|nr:uncharacterized protein RHIMIDRAFT_264093 [Rhizopus microsporus ATCC 52813]ORE02300.1 hypothetical protein BCV72DRAFT_234901 [Rhizopus microsporus var. microsporus]PHZ09146.1 hypothetical protein RHIMIDRAFT_264093 [Rhizopus microsporus ATCC 52813]
MTPNHFFLFFILFFMTIHSHLSFASSLHPKIDTCIELDDIHDDCFLDIVYELPASVFVDPYQLRDMESRIGKAEVFGEHDLELPLEKVKEPRGSIVLLRQTNLTSPIRIQLPIHTRYQKPASHQQYRTVTIKVPYAGWTCGASSWPPIDHELLIPYNRYHTNSRFIPISNIDPKEQLELSVPVGSIQDRQLVTLGTFCIVILCSAWIARSMLVSVKRRKRTEAKGKRRKSD